VETLKRLGILSRNRGNCQNQYFQEASQGFTVDKIISDKFVEAGDILKISIIMTTAEAEKSNQIKSNQIKSNLFYSILFYLILIYSIQIGDESPRWDLNPRPRVYETLALPAELLGH
jgi:hypothetical protein